MPTRVYIPTEPYTPTGESMYAQPAPDNELVAPPQEQGAVSRGINRLLGTQFGEERYQTWPEKMVRSAATLAGDVVSGAVPVLPPGSRREDFTDEPAPGVPDNAPWWKMAPVAAQPNDLMMERAQDLAGVAMGGGIGGTGKAAAAGEAVLGSGPVRQIMRNSEMPVASAREQQLLRKAVREAAEAGDSKPFNEHPRQDVPIKDLLATQEEVAPKIVQEKLRDKAYDDNDVFIVKHDGKYYVEDGHHTIAAASQAGRPTINGHVQEIGGKSAPDGGATLHSDSTAGTGIAAVKNAPAWYSAVEHALEQSTTGSAPGAQWLATLRNSRGVKPEEMAWLGLDDYLAAAQLEGRKVTRAELQDYVKSHQVELKDVEKSGKRPSEYEPDEFATDAEYHAAANRKDAPRYSDYQLPGGENYREHLITMPSKSPLRIEPVTKISHRLVDSNTGEMIAHGTPEAMQAKLQELQPWAQGVAERNGNAPYKSSHWDEPNILAHVRTNDRVIDGKKSLHLEEVQSDWHQQGRDKGYKNPIPEKDRPAAIEKVHQLEDTMESMVHQGKHVVVNGNEVKPSPEYAALQAEKTQLIARIKNHDGVPDAPFKKSWHELALKRMLRRAAEEGYERLSWTPGEAQAARYDLSKQVDRVMYDPKEQRLVAIGPNRQSLIDKKAAPEELSDLIGKEAAKKLLDTPITKKTSMGDAHILENADLKVGGEGMKGFYDDILPKALQKIGKEHGVKVQKGEIDSPGARIHAESPEHVRPHLKLPNSDKQPIFYIDIPQSLRDAAMRKGFPLFSGGKMFVPHQEEDK